MQFVFDDELLDEMYVSTEQGMQKEMALLKVWKQQTKCK